MFIILSLMCYVRLEPFGMGALASLYGITTPVYYIDKSICSCRVTCSVWNAGTLRDWSHDWSCDEVVLHRCELVSNNPKLLKTSLCAINIHRCVNHMKTKA